MITSFELDYNTLVRVAYNVGFFKGNILGRLSLQYFLVHWNKKWKENLYRGATRNLAKLLEFRKSIRKKRIERGWTQRNLLRLRISDYSGYGFLY